MDENIQIAIQRIAEKIEEEKNLDLSNEDGISLGLAGLNLTEIPEDILELKHLNDLDLSSNNLAILPDWFEKFATIKYLDLRNNNFQALPEFVFDFEAAKNIDFSDPPFPDRYQRGLFLYGNQLIKPPVEVLEGGYRTVLHYFWEEEENENDADPHIELSEYRLLVLGDLGAGKSTFIEKIGNILETSTLGKSIAITKSNLSDQPEESLIVKFWEFDNQLTSNSFYNLFLFKEEGYILVHSLTFSNKALEYWLHKSIWLADEEPLITICNKQKMSDSPLNVRAIRRRVKNFHRKLETIDLQRGTSSFFSLRQEINYRIRQRFNFKRIKVPSQWNNLIDELRAKSENKALIDWNQLEELFEKNGVRRNELKIYFAQILHSTGVIYNHSDDDELKKLIVLDPEWLIEAYNDLTAKAIRFEGFLESSDLEEIVWHGEKFKNYRVELKLLLIKVGLMYQIADVDNQNPLKHFFIPYLLPTTPVEIPTGIVDSLKLKITFEDYQPNLIYEFIARFCPLNELNVTPLKQAVWKEGFTNIETGISIYSSPEELSVIGLFWGSSKWQWLQRIADYAIGYHRNPSFRGEIKATVFCPCDDCKQQERKGEFSFEKISKAIESRKSSIPCPIYDEPVEIEKFGVIVFKPSFGGRKNSLSPQNDPVVSLIGEGEIEKALDILIEKSQDDNDLIALKSEYKTALKNLNLGIINSAESPINRIRTAILQINAQINKKP